MGFPDVLTNTIDLGFPNISVAGYSPIGEPVQYPEDRHDSTLHLSDNVAWTYGQNQFKFGGEFRYVRIDDYIDFVARGDWNFLGDTAFGILQAFGQCPGPTCPSISTLALAQLLAGVPDAAAAVSGNTANSLRAKSMGYYIQDDIHVVPRFLLNVGMRYEYNGAPVEAQNHFSVPNLSSGVGYLYSTTQLPIHPSRNEWNSPRRLQSHSNGLRPAHWFRLAAFENGALGGPRRVRSFLRQSDFANQHLSAH